MNIAHTLEKPKVTRGMRRRRIRRIKLLIHMLICSICVSSAVYALYWAFLGMIHLAGLWVVPIVKDVWLWMTELSSHNRFFMFNQLMWGVSTIGILFSVVWLFCSSCWVRRVVTTCALCSYTFLTYVSWLVLRTFFQLPFWASYGYAVIAIIVLLGGFRLFRRGGKREPVEETV